MTKAETKTVEVTTISSRLTLIDGEPCAPTGCETCYENKFEAFENMNTGRLEFICVFCQTRVGSNLRAFDWDVM
jgi:hypothetical protein